MKGIFIRILLPLMLFFSLSGSAWSQTRSVSGHVFDENGEPMVGAVVFDPAHPEGGAISDAEGYFSLKVNSKAAVVRVSMVGFRDKDVPVGKASKIYMEVDSETLKEAVVTGIFTRNKESFSGSAQTVSADDIKRVGNTNAIDALKNLDPSLLVLENLAEGSNPNAMQSMQIRGASTLTQQTSSLKSDFLTDGNTPLFILDGFETTLVKIQDMDMNRIQSITILKDASAKAIYGSKGANGVVVIETKRLISEKTLVTYTGSTNIEAPDLTSYNLCNALEKLEIERRENYYFPKSSNSQVIASAQEVYSMRLKKALEGESTYWLSKPLRLGLGQKHSLAIELGTKDLKAIVNFGYSDTQGVMKGSYRDVYSGDVNLSYRQGKWTFRNIMSVSQMNSEDSPWGSFDEYAKMNPYYSPYDSDGNILKIVDSGSYGTGEGKFSYAGSAVTNPMYNAQIGTRYGKEYLDFTDNFYVEYQPVKALRIVARAGISTDRTSSEDFKPADHTDYASYTQADDLLTRGSYNVSNGTRTAFSGDVSAQFNHKFANKHDVFATAQYNISETTYEEIQHYTQGFSNSNMTSITFARQYAKDATPTGGDGLNRNLGALLTTGYSYDNRYMMDATVKGSASSVFGTNNRWGTFWSMGLAWNLHNENFMKSKLPNIKEFKLRTSIGSSGNQNYSTNVSLPVYSYYSSSYYNGFSGAVLGNMENPDLGWEEKMDYNVGIDFRTRRINSVLDFYIADTRNMVFTRSLLPSSGFSTVSDNLGKVRNKGVELSLSYMFYQKGASYFSVFGKAALNDNRVLEISEAMEAYNSQQQALAKESGSTAPIVQYYNGMPLHSIWAVRSLGIDAMTGNEVFLNRNDDIVTTWSASDLVNCGSSDPLFNGNFGVNGEIKGFGTSVVFTFYGGGKLYNSTLVGRVENTDISDNVDRRIFEGRWYERGKAAKYRSASSSNYYTRATTRFVQDNNVMNVSSISLYYELPYSFVQKLRMRRLRATVYTNNLFTFSSIDIERGTSYPYSRTFSLSLTATF